MALSDDDKLEACFHCGASAQRWFCCPSCSGPANGVQSIGAARYLVCFACYECGFCKFCGRNHIAEEHDDAKRMRKRQNAVAAIRKIPEHEYLSELLAAGMMFTIPTPKHVPEDAAVSKRQWEQSIQEWRNEVMTLAADCGFSDLSKERKESSSA